MGLYPIPVTPGFKDRDLVPGVHSLWLWCVGDQVPESSSTTVYATRCLLHCAYPRTATPRPNCRMLSVMPFVGAVRSNVVFPNATTGMLMDILPPPASEGNASLFCSSPAECQLAHPVLVGKWVAFYK